MPLLTRMVATPLAIDIRPGRRRGARAAAWRTGGSRAEGHVAVAVGPVLGEELARRCGRSSRTRVLPGRGRHARGARASSPRSCARARSTRSSGSAAAARSTWRSTPRRSRACRWSRSRRTWPTTGSRRPCRRSCTTATRGPTACRCRWRSWWTSTTSAAASRACAARASAMSVSNLSAIADWRLAEEARGEPVDGDRGHVRAHGGRRGAAPRGRDRGRRVPGRARRVARPLGARDGDGRQQPPVQRRRARDPARDRRAVSRTATPTTASSRAPPACSRASCGERGAGGADRRVPRAARPAAARRSDLGLDEASSPRPCCARRATRPDRYTILEHLDLDEEGVREPNRCVRRGLRSLSCRAATQPPEIFARNSGEHWAGRLYIRRFSPYATRLFLRAGLSPNAVTWLFVPPGSRPPRCWPSTASAWPASWPRSS